MKKRPVNLDLMTLKFPVPSIISILHRVSGVIVFLLIPVLLFLLSCSLKSSEQFEKVVQWLSSPIIKLMVLGFFVALIYHLFAGCRHLLMDCGIGESLQASRRSSYVVFILTLIATIGFGIWLW